MNTKLLFLFSILISLTISSCSSKSESITPQIKSITESVYATGFITSKNQYQVFGNANGIIKKIYVDEGIPVKKGDPIFQLDNKNLKITTENYKLAAIAADFKKNTNKLNDAKKAIELAMKNLKNDSLQYERQKKLWNQNIGSKVEFEQKLLNYEKSKTDFARTKTNYDDLKSQLKLASDQSKNNLEIAQLLEDTFIIRSEVDGVVYKINKEEGELINGQQPVAIIGTAEFMIELSIDEKDIVKIKKGQQVLLRMDSYTSQVFEATIISIDPMMNIRTRSFQAKAIFTRKPEALFPNLTVEANIIIHTKEKALTIPRDYLVNNTYVRLQDGNLQKVETGLMDYDIVEIKDGIDETTKIDLPKR